MKRRADDEDEALSVRDTLHATDDPEIGSRDTQFGTPHIGTLKTISPIDATMVSEGSLPSPDIDRLEVDQIKGAIMADLFGSRPEATRIGRFKVLDRLGEGGMGVVYSAYDEQLDRRVAIKVLRGDVLGRDQGARLRLVREAQAMARLDHPNLITVHEAGEHDGQVFVAMEFVRGQDLNTWLRARPHWREVVDVFLAAGAGIAAAHAAGIIHRDLKPHNVMHGDDGAVKVLDFGLARAIGASERLADRSESTALVDARLTRTGSVLGTPAYMSPEQHEGADLDERSDQFSFCAALYEGLYAQLPFTGETMAELVNNTRTGNVRPAPADSTVPAWVARIVRRGLERSPEDRFPSMVALLAELGRDPARRRRRTLAIAGFAALMAGGGFTAASLAADDRPSPCAGASEELAAVWGAKRHDELDAALSSADPLIGAATWQRIAPKLDAHGDSWVEMRTEACESHQSGRQSAHLLDLRMACLDRRLAGLGSLTEALAAADGAIVLNAVNAVNGLAPIAGCGDIEALSAPVPMPEDPETRRLVRTHQKALEETAAYQLTGRYKEALASAEAIEVDAVKLDYAPLTAEVALARGRALQDLGEAEAASASLSTALMTGLRGHAEESAAEAAIRRIFVTSELMGDPKSAILGIDLADALVDRAGDSPRLRWLWANNAAGAVDHSAQQPERAIELYKLASKVSLTHELETSATITTVNLGVLFAARADHLSAASHWTKGASELGRLLGDSHPEALRTHLMAAQAYAELGRVSAARAELNTPLRLLSQRLGEDATQVQVARLLAAELEVRDRNYDVALNTAKAISERAEHPFPAAESERLLAVALLGLGRRDEALVHARSAVDRAGDDDGWRLVQLSYLGDTLTRANLHDEAIVHLTEALAGAVAGLGEDATEVAIVRTQLARAHLARGDVDEALAEVTRARDILLESAPKGPDLTRAYALEGSVHLARDEWADAEVALRAALKGAATFDDDSPETAAIRFELAQALGELAEGALPAEARQEAEAARGVYEARGDAFAPEADAIRAWLTRQNP